MKILKREINSYKSKSINIDKMYGVSPNLSNVLKERGIKTNKDLYILNKNESDINKLTKELGIEKNELDKLLTIADLTRINGIGPVFAYLLYEEGINNIEKLINNNTKDLVDKINRKMEDIYQKKTMISSDF